MHILWPLLSSLGFACMGVCIKLGASQFSVAETVFYRSVIVVLLLEIYRRHAGQSLRTPYLQAHLLRSVVGTAGMTTYFTAIALIPLATAVTLVYTGPLFIAAILFYWYRESPPRGAGLALVGGFLGVMLLLRPSLAQDQWLGAAIGLASGFISALAMLNVRRLGAIGEPEWRTVYIFSAVAALAGLIWALAGSGFHRPDLRGVLLAAGMGVFGMVGQIFMTISYKRGKALLAANLSYSTVVFASLAGSWLWGEDHTPLAWVGMLLIMAAGMAMGVLSRRPQAIAAD